MRLFSDNKTSPRDGYVILIGVLIMGAVAASIATSVLLSGIGSSKSSLIQQQAYQAQSVANACAEIAIAELDADTSYAGETIDPLGAGSCIVSIEQPCPSSICTIEATGTVGPVTRKTKVTATVGSGGGLLLGKGSFPISPATLTNTIASPTGTVGIAVRDNAATPNRPVNESFEIAGATTPIIHLNGTGSMTRNNRGNVGDVVNIDGSGFVTDLATTGCPLLVLQCANIRWDGVNSSPLVQCDTGSTGSFTNCAYTIPQSIYGRHQITGRDQGSALPLPSGSAARTSLNQTFFVEPKITATACSGTPKTTTINGTGFAASSTVTITWDNADTTTTRTTGTNGSFTSTVNFTLPVTGTHKIGAHDASRNFATDLSYTCTF